MRLQYIVPTPIGPMEIVGSELGIQRVQLREKPPASANYLDSLDSELLAEHPVVVCARQLAEYFAGDRQEFELTLDWSGASEFHQKVWAELRHIPFGKTTTYATIAAQIGNPSAVRAVGMANRSNPLAIIVPCHRVIGKAGELRGYFYGLDVKMRLLRHENPVRFAEQGALFD